MELTDQGRVFSFFFDLLQQGISVNSCTDFDVGRFNRYSNGVGGDMRLIPGVETCIM